MILKSNISERRRIQNREAQLRFRERAKKKKLLKSKDDQQNSNSTSKEGQLSTLVENEEILPITIKDLQTTLSAPPIVFSPVQSTESLDQFEPKDFIIEEIRDEGNDGAVPISDQSSFLTSSTSTESQSVNYTEESIRNTINFTDFMENYIQEIDNPLQSSDSESILMPSVKPVVKATPKTYVEFLVQSERLPSPPGPSQLLLPRMHFIRAAEANAARLGLSFDYIHNCDAISSISQAWSVYQKRPSPDRSTPDLLQVLNGSKKQYAIIEYALNAPEVAHLLKRKMNGYSGKNKNVLNMQKTHQWTWNNVADNMKPTDIQINVEHQPLIDAAFPWKSMRDKIILLKGIFFDPEKLCISTIYGEQSAADQPFTIWGDDPSDETSWEVSESFIRSWWFLIDKEILRRTNWWRRQRGERLIIENRIL